MRKLITVSVFSRICYRPRFLIKGNILFRIKVPRQKQFLRLDLGQIPSTPASMWSEKAVLILIAPHQVGTLNLE